MATHSTVLAWEIQWTEEPGGLQSMGHELEIENTSYHPPFLTGEALCIWCDSLVYTS